MSDSTNGVQYRPKRVYLAGPMRGIKDFNFPAFDAAADFGRQQGFDVVSPADMDREAGFDGVGKLGNDDEWSDKMQVAEVLRRDFEAVIGCDAIALLPGWENSRGANMEFAAAQLMHLEVLDARTFLPYNREQRTHDVGRKLDDGKPRYDLLAPEALAGLVAVLTFGAEKYADRNWERGITYHRVFAAAMRHLWLWWVGEDNDTETSLSHLDHAMCNIHFLSTYVKRNMTEFDDRPKA